VPIDPSSESLSLGFLPPCTVAETDEAIKGVKKDIAIVGRYYRLQEAQTDSIV
jgi:hypothetical protein